MTTKCNDVSTIYDDVPFCLGQKSVPGLKRYVFIASKRDIVKWPKWPDINSAKSLEELAVLDGNFTLAADKVWIKVELAPKENEFVSESQGTWPNKTFKNTANLVAPGTEQKVTGFVNAILNDEIVSLVPQANGRCRCIGNETWSPDLNVGQNTGKAETDASQTPITIEGIDFVSAPFYDGEILTSDGVYMGSTCMPKADAEGV